MLDFITKIFHRDESSRSMAKERLRLVLMSDRVALAPETFDLMKGEMLSVLQRYVEVDEHADLDGLRMLWRAGTSTPGTVGRSRPRSPQEKGQPHHDHEG